MQGGVELSSERYKGMKHISGSEQNKTIKMQTHINPWWFKITPPATHTYTKIINCYLDYFLFNYYLDYFLFNHYLDYFLFNYYLNYFLNCQPGNTYHQ